MLVREWQEVQALSRGLDMAATTPSEPVPQRLAAVREQLKLLSDYL